MSSASFPGRFAPWVLVAVVLFFLLPGTATLPLLDRDEPRFAQATVEMSERGNWIVPTFGGRPRYDKPALSYWIIAGGMAIAGPGEFGARLGSIACTLLLVLFVWRTGQRWFGPQAGFIAGFALATSLQIFVHGRLAVADLPMVLSVTVAMVALAELLGLTGVPEKSGAAMGQSRWWWALYLSLGFGFLAKGPIGLAVPLVALLSFRFLPGRIPLDGSRLKAGRGLLLSLAIVAVWGLPALMVTRGEFWTVGIGEHVIQRGLEPFNDRPYHVWFYLASAPVSLFPWVAYAGTVWQVSRRNRDPATAWLVAWMLAPVLIFTGYGTQLPHYVLPALPAFFLLLGRALATSGPVPAGTRFGRVLVQLWAAVLLLAVGLVATWPTAPSLVTLRAGLACLLIIVAGMGLSSLVVTGRRSLLGYVGIGLVVLGSLGLGQAARAVHLVVSNVARWRQTPANVRLVGFNFSEPSLVFYVGRPWWWANNAAELNSILAVPGPVRVTALARECDVLTLFRGRPQWMHRPEPEAFVGQAFTELQGLNMGRGTWQVLRVYSRPE